MAEQWPVFICYRQSDGMATARRLYERLHGLSLPLVETSGEAAAPPELDVYFDQAAPGVEDWKSIHEPYLKRARAMLVICTPGAKLVEGDDDWVHAEINWWLENREVAPILVDPIGDATRYVPEAILAKYPDAQRIRIIENEWSRFTPDELKAANERLVAQLVGGIVPSGKNFFKQEFEQEQRRVAELNDALARQRQTSGRLVWAIGAMSVLVVLSVAAVIYAFIKTGEAEQARVSAEEALAELRTTSLRNSVLSAQQYLTRRDYRLAIETAAPLRAEAIKPDSPIADQSEAIDRVIIHAANNLVTAVQCHIDPETLSDLQFAPDGSVLVGVQRDYSIVRWTIPNCGDAQTVFKHNDALAGVAFSGGRFASASWDRVLRLESGSTVSEGRLQGGTGRVVSIGYGPGDGPLAVATNRGDIFNVAADGAAGSVTETPVALPDGADAVGLTGGTIVVDMAGSIGFVAASTGELAGPFRVPTSSAEQALSLDDKRYAVVRDNREVLLLGPDTSVRQLARLDADIRGIAVSADSSAIVAFTETSLAYLPLTPDTPQQTLSPFTEDIRYAQAAPSGLLIAAAEDDTIRLIDARSGDTVWQALYYWLGSSFPTVSPDASYVAFPVRGNGVTVRRLVRTADEGIEVYCDAVPTPQTIAICNPAIAENGD
jgi:hypothetical protein